MSKVYRIYYCSNCDEEFESTDEMYECSKCGEMLEQNGRFVECDCGEIVMLTSHTNWCDECGQMYNLFGQELAPVDEWDEEDRYGSFSPDAGDDW